MGASTSTYFLVNLTDRADIQIDVFTISGKRIRRLEQMGDPGEVWINWDGKDSVGFLLKVKEFLEDPSKMLFSGKDPVQTLLGL